MPDQEFKFVLAPAKEEKKKPKDSWSPLWVIVIVIAGFFVSYVVGAISLPTYRPTEYEIPYNAQPE